MPRRRSSSSPINVRSATDAYRADMAERELPFGEHDSGWLVAATLLEQAALIGGVEREMFLRDAIEIAEDMLGSEALVRLGGREWENRDPSRVDPLIFLADAAHFAGALNLAAAMFDALLAAGECMADVTRGRVMAKRARVTHKLSNYDEAADRYKQVELLGKRAGITELRIRAALGFIVLAQLRGNYPQVARFARRARTWAVQEGFRELSRQAHYGLMMASAKAGQFGDALVAGWAMYEASVGEPVEEATVMVNLGQLLLEAGDADTARAAFATVVSRPLPVRLLLPGLGGLAVASAAGGEEATLEWAVQEVLGMRGSTAPRFLVASTLLECATALAAVGRRDEAERHRRDALRLSQMYGFHEVAFRAEALDTANPAPIVPRGAPLGRRAAGVASCVQQIAPDDLPTHVSVAAVTAGR